MKIRAETASDRDAIRALHVCCFPTADEADLVDRPREEGDTVFSLVSEVGDCLTGHVLFSRMTAPFRALGLAPVAVFPEWRRLGVAARLTEKGLALAVENGWDAVSVLGEPAYYGRFGFDAAAAQAFQSPYAGPYFMVRPLGPNLPVAGGRVDYAKAFAALG
ncbi:MAG TPA: N-acetyltransferase [Rhizomicrobium sp.]|nr:N-acetyltransferase [Rhizomicrobium sp.]